MQSLKDVVIKTQAAVIVIHNENKKWEPGMELGLQHMRGSTTIGQHCLSIIGICQPNEGSHHAKVAMIINNFGHEPEPIGLTAKPTTLISADGARGKRGQLTGAIGFAEGLAEESERSKPRHCRWQLRF